MSKNPGNMITMRRDIFIFSGITIGCLMFIFWLIPVFTPPYPGYGVSAALLPNVVVGLILALSVLSLIRILFVYRSEKGKDPTPQEEIKQADRVHLGHLALFMVPSFLIMPAMGRLGFIPAGIVFMLFIQYLCGQRKPLTAIIVAACSVGAVYATMRFGLGVPMP